MGTKELQDGTLIFKKLEFEPTPVAPTRPQWDHAPMEQEETIQRS